MSTIEQEPAGEDESAGPLGRGEWTAIIGGVVVVLAITLFVLAHRTYGSSSASAPAPSPSPVYNASDGPCVTAVLGLLDTDMRSLSPQGEPNGVDNGQVAQQYGSDSKVWSAFTRGHIQAVQDVQGRPLHNLADETNELRRLKPAVRKACG